MTAHRRAWPIPERIDWFRAPDGVRVRYAHWAPPAGRARQGVVVFFSGRTEFIEKNAATYRDLLDRGFEIWTLDWRGQGLSDRLLAGANDQDKGHVASFDDYVRDAEQFLDQVVKLQAASGAKVLLAHSMGGQIALRYLLAHPGAFNRAVLTSPLLRVPKDVFYVRWGNAIKNVLGFGNRCVLGEEPEWSSDFNVPSDSKEKSTCGLADSGDETAQKNALRKPSDTEKYTHDWQKLAERTCLIEKGRSVTPNLGLACPTSAWLRAAYRSTDVTLADRARLRTPTLIIPARNDTAVDNKGQKEFCDAQNPSCCLASEIADAGHELLIELQPIRARVLGLFDRFVGSDASAEAFCRALKSSP